MKPIRHSISTRSLAQNARRLSKKYLPPAAVTGLQKTIRLSRSAKLRLESAFHPESFVNDPFPTSRIQYVRPKDINYWFRRVTAPFSTSRDQGRLLDGDWDLNVNERPIHATQFYAAYEMRLKSNTPWPETPYYQRVKKAITSGEVLWNCRSIKEFDAKCAYWDSVYRSIRDEGYRSGAGDDEVSVNIDRNGRLLLNDGFHRLVFCKLLGVRQIPVEVVVRHRKWLDFKHELYDFIKSGRHSQPGMAYAPILHPDLHSVPSQHGHDRFEILKNHVHGKRILDIGAHLGYFCHRFEELDHECVAVESHPDIVYFLKKLHAAQERKFRIVEESVVSFIEREHPVVDTVLALSIFHHFLKEEYLYEQLVKLLNNLTCKEIIFEPHDPAEPQMRGAFRNFDSEAFMKFMLENSRLTRAAKIGVAKDGRDIFRLF
jgi:hypothetical protein